MAKRSLPRMADPKRMAAAVDHHNQTPEKGMSSAINIFLGAPRPESLAFPLGQVYPWMSCQVMFCVLMSRKIGKSLTLRIEQGPVFIVEEMSFRMDRIEQTLLRRSDAMRRVLLRVDDLGLAVAESTDKMRESILSLEDRLVSCSSRQWKMSIR